MRARPPFITEESVAGSVIYYERPDVERFAVDEEAWEASHRRWCEERGLVYDPPREQRRR